MPAAPNAFWGGIEAGKDCTATFPERHLVDYKLPERNLDFPAYWLGHCCERMGAHYGLYDRFMRHGGIEGVIRQLGVVPLRRDVFWGGGIGAVWIV